MSTSRPATEDRFKLHGVAFFGRMLAEYLQMFALDVDRLRGRTILDVASGPGSFVAESLVLGLDATGCDPMYAQDTDTIVAQGKTDIEACRRQIRQHPGVLAYRDINRFFADKHAALESFAADFRHRGGARYVAGALPDLPFADRAYDLVLTANFLMTYAPLADGGMHEGTEFDLRFHRQAVGELARVARQELRVASMHTWTQPPRPHPYRKPLMAALETLGFTVELVPTDYDDGCSAGDLGQVDGSPGDGPVRSVLVATRR